MKLTAVIAQTGYGLSGDIGGLPRTTYYTPDGRVIKAFPDIRGFARRDMATGQVIETGTRDANLDRGLLLSPPEVVKVFCPTCDKWHDTAAEVIACQRRSGKFIAQMSRKAKREEVDRTTTLEEQVARLTAQIAELTRERNGGIFQSKANGPTQMAIRKRVRTAKKGV